jgi:hypothetical protein
MGIIELTSDQRKFLAAALDQHQTFIWTDLIQFLSLSRDTVAELRKLKLLKVDDVFAELTVAGLKLAKRLRQMEEIRALTKKGRWRWIWKASATALVVLSSFWQVFVGPTLSSIVAKRFEPAPQIQTSSPTASTDSVAATDK